MTRSSCEKVSPATQLAGNIMLLGTIVSLILGLLFIPTVLLLIHGSMKTSKDEMQGLAPFGDE